MSDLAHRLMQHPEISSMVVHHRVLPPLDAVWGTPGVPLSPAMRHALTGIGEIA